MIISHLLLCILLHKTVTIGLETWIKPAFGLSNDRLLLSVPIDVLERGGNMSSIFMPSDFIRSFDHTNSERDNMHPDSSCHGFCSQIHVGGTSRWLERNKGILWTDSFLHQLFNACENDVVLFELELAHPSSISNHLNKQQAVYRMRLRKF